MSLLTDKSEFHSEHELGRSASRNRELQMRTMVPGTIVSFNRTTFRATVQVEIQKLHEGEWVTIDILQDIPVHPACIGNIFLGIYPVRGEEGMVMVCDREIETWKISGGVVRPRYARLHQITDSWFLPGRLSESAVSGIISKVNLMDCMIEFMKAVEKNPGPAAPIVAAIRVKLETALALGF